MEVGLFYFKLEKKKVITLPLLVAQMVKNPCAMRETWVGSLGQEDPLEQGMVNHSGILTWRISMERGTWRAAVSQWGRKESDMTERLSTTHNGVITFFS